MLASAVNEEDGKIHIFSLATGHLYERLLRIMMLSVSETKRAPLSVVTIPFPLCLDPLLCLCIPVCPCQVTKRTSLPVKFWLFENYLSPSFKTIAAAMAQEYHFEVGALLLTRRTRVAPKDKSMAHLT